MNSVINWIDSVVNKIAKNYTLWIIGLVMIAVIIGLKAYSLLFPRLPDPQVYASSIELQPEWNGRRERYYQTSQGSLAIPYAWFQALESRTGKEMFASPEIQARYGLLPDNDPKHNPDQLPVGIVKDIVRDEYVATLGEGHKEWASLSCAACHTGQLRYNGTALRIDGGQSFWGFEQWSGDLANSLLLTSTIPSRFERFCARVYRLGENGECSPDEKKVLRIQLKRYFDSYLFMGGVNENINHTYLSKEGFARTAALGRGPNGMFAPITYKNVKPNSGPVSYPPLWYTHNYDWVQSVAAIRQPLGRNVTESWGVSVRVELDDPARHSASTPKRHASTHKIEDMFWMETLISILKAPKWPEDVLGKINLESAERGRILYWEEKWADAPAAAEIELPASSEGLIRGPNPKRTTNGLCARCHAPAYELTSDGSPGKYLQLPLYDLKKMGTDESDAVQFNSRQVYTGFLSKDKFGGQERVDIGTALKVNISGVLDLWFKEHNVPQDCREIMEGKRENLFRAPLGYPARPLDGYWATGPFLHNGSVRTLYELLSPVEERAKSFWIGTREFDPVYVGFRNDPVEGAFLFDTSQLGNHNTGHEFRNAFRNTPGVIGPLLTDDQRRDIIEYLKVLASVEIPPEEMERRYAFLKVYEKYQGSVAEKAGGLMKTNFCSELVEADKNKPSVPVEIKGLATPIPSVPPKPE
jgi:hypothetical protein